MIGQLTQFMKDIRCCAIFGGNGTSIKVCFKRTNLVDMDSPFGSFIFKPFVPRSLHLLRFVNFIGSVPIFLSWGTKYFVVVQW